MPRLFIHTDTHTQCPIEEQEVYYTTIIQLFIQHINRMLYADTAGAGCIKLCVDSPLKLHLEYTQNINLCGNGARAQVLFHNYP